MTGVGGVVNRQRIFVNELPDGLKCVGIRRYGEDDIARVYSDLPAGGLGVMIAPASSRVQLSFALNAPTYERFAIRPLIGWISGVHPSELGKATPQGFRSASREG